MATKSVQLESKFVTVEGVRIHYQEVGEGTPLICIHGAGPGASSASNFKNNTPVLSEKFRVILYDMPQFGKSEKVAIDEGRLTFNGRILKGFMEQINVEKASFLGNSMGGQAALKLAIDNPERVERLAVIGSTPVALSVFNPQPLEGIKMIAGYYKGDGPSREKMRALVETLVYDSSFLTDDVLEERYQSSIDPEVLDLHANRQKPLPKQDLLFELSKIKAKTLLIWGLDDRFGALDIGLTMLRYIQGAQMHVFSNCGHWAQVEHADEFNRLTTDFFSH
jgi:pimeloyl-ACP methyl ester carboxylesterase